MEVTCDSLSVLGACLANGGICPTTQEVKCGCCVGLHRTAGGAGAARGEGRPQSNAQLRHVQLQRTVRFQGTEKSIGEKILLRLFKVGLPAKSGVSGALVLVVPGVMGVGLWSPALDQLGNTVRGVNFAEKFIERFNFHRFDNLAHLRSKVDPRKHRYDVCQQSVTSLLYSATTGDVTALRRFHAQVNY